MPAGSRRADLIASAAPRVTRRKLAAATRAHTPRAVSRPSVAFVELWTKGERRKVNPRRKVPEGEDKMAYRRKQSWPADRIQRTLRANEALVEIVHAQRVFLASRKPDIDALTARQKERSLTRPEAIQRLVDLGPKIKAK
jgi:hypothetical protein